ncbi:hypothetical protein RZ532_03350 [Nitratireductor aquimarinus]|uniref:hypothetical protein n=1 Tax=Nitratireductor aquimarinus TaxID=889300 RepID=UPI0029361D45|nr:hypothetical protein [Nitratireductor aquimarinus]MDV2964996.1 hypothetical protein [Nitratireductor aquimarinus]
MRLRAVFNKRFHQWRICHDQPCEKGETSIVATVTTSLDDEADERLARQICERFNIPETPLGKIHHLANELFEEITDYLWDACPDASEWENFDPEMNNLRDFTYEMKERLIREGIS